ncbi:MAG: bzdV [Proteobacteria bacterium]|nr:bzdV [Pseudomonadota bacterium]
MINDCSSSSTLMPETHTGAWWEASRTAGLEAFGPPVNITIDGREFAVPAGASVLNALIAADIYVPHLCTHPDLPPACRRGEGGGCNLCAVETSARPGKVSHACKLDVVEGMAVRTDLPVIRVARQAALAKILANHPHVCLTCPEREACNRLECAYQHPPEDRCCDQFSHCELRQVADFVGIRANTPDYQPVALPVIKDEPLFDRDYNLCVDCRRCLTVCNDIRGVGCLELKSVETPQGTRTYVGTIAPTLVESGCKFCRSCVAVCPTGALTDRTLHPGQRDAATAPCHAACPAGIDVSRYVQLAAEGKYGEAIAVVREKLPFPGILGRACFAMCESACLRGHLDDPLSIRGLKRTADDNDTGIWRQYSKQLPPTGKRVAIIGAGPGGLTAAWYLAKKGHAVTVFDAHPAAGGTARYGIPSYRVPNEVVDREVGEVEKLGVKFEFGQHVDDLDTLFAAGFAATFIAIGCQGGDRLGVAGDDLPGVIDSPTYLRAAAMGLVNAPGSGIATGNKVAVIGGGNVAADNARSSHRFGAKVDIIYRRTAAEIPMHEHELAGCLEEGVNLRYLLAPKRIEPGRDGARLSITYARMAAGAPDASGRCRPVDTGEEISEGVDLVISAVGQHTKQFAGFGVQTDDKGRIVVRENSLLTSRPAVYAGGDCVLGPSTLIESVAHGRLAAAAIDRQLGGDGDIEEKLLPDDWQTSPHLGTDPEFNRRRKTHPLKLAPAARSGWEEIESAYSDDAARAEAARCFKCNLTPQISEAVKPPES